MDRVLPIDEKSGLQRTGGTNSLRAPQGPTTKESLLGNTVKNEDPTEMYEM